ERIGSSSLHPHEWLSQQKAVLVPVTTIDDYVREHQSSRSAMMKIEIEGAELEAFEGMTDTFRLCPPGIILCELIPLNVTGRAQSSPAPSQMAQFLISRGYEMF